MPVILAGKRTEGSYLDEAYTKINGESYWSLLALRGNRFYLGAVPSPHQGEGSWVKLLEALEIPEGGKGLLVLHDSDQAFAAALRLVLPRAIERSCAWHQQHDVFMQARELCPDNPGRERGNTRAAQGRLPKRMQDGIGGLAEQCGKLASESQEPSVILSSLLAEEHESLRRHTHFRGLDKGESAC